MKNFTYTNHTRKKHFIIGDKVHCKGFDTNFIGVVRSMSNRYYSNYDGYVYNILFSDGTGMDVTEDAMTLVSEPSEILKEIL